MEFNNLFNGNKLLENYANQFLSRNWRELYNFFGPGVTRSIRNVLDKVLTDANEFLALDELYPFPEGTVLIPSKY
ncbi:hypothetical protein C0J52_05274 [Blattella germanica]|nr:hypothetical protein C0J52_05274 [Blattella germanica]